MDGWCAVLLLLCDELVSPSDATTARDMSATEVSLEGSLIRRGLERARGW